MRLSRRSLLTAFSAMISAPTTLFSDQRDEDEHSPILLIESALPGYPRERVEWLAENYGYNASSICEDHGEAGADVLWILRDQGLAILREQPGTFKEMTPLIGGELAGLALAYHSTIIRDLARQGSLPQFLRKIEELPKDAKRAARVCPELLPYLAIAPRDVLAAYDVEPTLCALALPCVDLSSGPSSLAKVCEIILVLGRKAKDWFEARGIDGLLLAHQFKPLIEQSQAFASISTFLQILSRNQDDLAIWLSQGKIDTAKNALEALRIADERGRSGTLLSGDLLTLACVDGRTLRWFAEVSDAVEILAATWEWTRENGGTLPSLIFDGYAYRPTLLKNVIDSLVNKPDKIPVADFPNYRRCVLSILASHGNYSDIEIADRPVRANRFRLLVEKLGPMAVGCLAEAELNPATAESQYDLLSDRGRDHLAEWNAPLGFWRTTLPFYDSARLAWLIANGYKPTNGELIFAGMDIVFTAVDLVSIGVGKAATQAVKVGVKTGVKAGGREALETVGQTIVKSTVNSAPKELVDQTTNALARGLASLPKTCLAVAETKLYKDIAVAAELAAETAKRFDIKLVACGITKYTAKEWAINLLAAGGLQQAATFAAKNSNALSGKKVQEALEWLNRQAL